MWGRKDEQPEPSSPAKPATPAPAPSAAPKPVERPSGTHAAPRAPKPVAPGTAVNAQIGKTLRVKGDITGDEDLYIDGVVEGTVTLENKSLTIGPNGKVQADVHARSIVLLGTLHGNVRAGERIEIRKTGSLEGDLVTNRIVIEDGAVFRGSIDIEKPNQAQVSAAKPNGVSKPAPAPGKAKTPAGKPLA